MRFEILIQFIVPLTFLAIWALTSILNRDAQPLPPRPGRPPGPGGVRPPGRPAQGRLNRAPPAAECPAVRLPPLLGIVRRPGPDLGSPPGSASPPRPRPRLGSLDEAIVYIENDPAARTASRPASALTGSTASGSRPARGGPTRRGGRSRTGVAGPAAQGKTEPDTPRALSDQVNQSLARQRSKPLEISPLGTPMSSLSSPLSHASVTPQFAQLQETGTAAPPPLTGVEVHKLLASPARLREVFMLTEILRPPLALRRHRQSVAPAKRSPRPTIQEVSLTVLPKETVRRPEPLPGSLAADPIGCR